MKRIHDPVKFVVSCVVLEVGFHIPSDRTSSIDTDRIPSNDIKKPTSIDATTSPSIDTGRVSENHHAVRKVWGKEEEKFEEEEKDHE
uniref:Uncharacterized protein n=1 Tax=Brassica campestris TaxID=3711 RepID=A0A3P6DW60_BRACM|nr:unnamed protein product [Brassica rapa]